MEWVWPLGEPREVWGGGTEKTFCYLIERGSGYTNLRSLQLTEMYSKKKKGEFYHVLMKRKNKRGGNSQLSSQNVVGAK